ncbi:uncharacterized protein PAC_09090 [Phialocephala subalpina]|uniref:Pre-rRNA-processing protein RIX1 n=1 Tax=Phialocephala subalpina TaxID=576137 RepID=A0A1L7X2E3_9HELO|nr:uncharacterized protein PAC_09090 [Phialocephala subalpina]
MSLPPELRVLCFQLSSTAVSELPRLTPTLLSYVLRCQAPLSMPAVAAGKAEASASAVLVHKLKTQLSTLLNGKSTEGRFTAVVMIKAVIEVGGWEVLNGSESWVRGLLSILGKPDPVATKELVVVALTKIYCMTHHYQTLVREITTPTLPAFVTACLTLVSPKSSIKPTTVPSSLEETVFGALAMLIPRHTTIFRPFMSQIRQIVRRYLAPTSSDGLFVPSWVKENARRLYVVLHQTAAKNTGGEEWSKAVRELIKETHATADQVFRAVIEDWESTTGYAGASVDVNAELRGGGTASEGLPTWSGIFAGIERLVGLMEMLAVYLKEETSAPIALPLADIMDVLNRMLSIAIPASGSGTGASARLHPGIDRDERDILGASLPQVYVAALQLVSTIAKRLEGSFLSVAQAAFDQLVWVFQFGKHDQEFRALAYEITAIVLMHLGQSLTRPQVGKCYHVLRSCCKDLEVLSPSLVNDAASLYQKSQTPKTHNADTFLQRIQEVPQGLTALDTAVTQNACTLLPLFFSHLPQQYIDISVRSLVERTAILNHNKDAMLASVLNPFVGKNGKAMASILPHLTREFGDDAVVEILLRPRMPLLPSEATRPPLSDAAEEESLDEDMFPPPDAPSMQEDIDGASTDHNVAAIGVQSPAAGFSVHTPTTLPPNAPSSSVFGTLPSSMSAPIGKESFRNSLPRSQQTSTDVDMAEVEDRSTAVGIPETDVLREGDESSSDDESVHLTMQLDTDSEEED